ncbi:hypothetical protein EBS02_04485 [bacterium]|nr:hypothetical protein [bacterium]
MGYHHVILPDPDTLNQIRKNLADDSLFLQLYWNSADAILGSDPSLSYIRQILETHEQTPI